MKTLSCESVWWDILVWGLLRLYLPCHFKETHSHSKLPDFLALRIFLPSSLSCSVSCRCGGCVVGLSVGAGHPTVLCSLYLDQLRHSVVASICCKGKLRRCGARAALNSEYKGQYLDAVRFSKAAVVSPLRAMASLAVGILLSCQHLAKFPSC